MAEPKADKKAESIAALKNANTHLAQLFTDLNKKDSALKNCADNLNRVAVQCGDLKVEFWSGNQRTTGSLKAYLEAIANNLTEARS